MKRFILMSALVLLIAVPASQAGGLVGVSIGQAKLDLSDGSESFNESDTSWKVFGEWHILKFFGVGLGYYDLGSPSGSVGRFDVNIDAKAWNLYAVGILPIGNLDLFGKVGYANWDVGGDADESGSDFAYGVGIAFKVASKIGIRLEYEIIDPNPDDISSADVDFWSLGVDFRF
jgi:opacity protein-like surface antigen